MVQLSSELTQQEGPASEERAATLSAVHELLVLLEAEQEGSEEELSGMLQEAAAMDGILEQQEQQHRTWFNKHGPSP